MRFAKSVDLKQAYKINKYERVMNVLIDLAEEIFSQCIHISSSNIVQFKYIIILSVLPQGSQNIKIKKITSHYITTTEISQ